MTRRLDEILEERVVSSRGQSKPRGVRKKMSKYPLRKRGGLSRKKYSWTPQINLDAAYSNIIGLRGAGSIVKSGSSVCLPGAHLKWRQDCSDIRPTGLVRVKSTAHFRLFPVSS